MFARSATRLLRPAQTRPVVVAAAAVSSSAASAASASPFSTTSAARTLRTARRPLRPTPVAAAASAQPQLSSLRQQRRAISENTRAGIDRAVHSAPVVLFMKGTPELPQCGFSRAAIQILGLQGVDPEKFSAFNVLEDPELREGIKEYSDWPTIPQLYVDSEFVGGCDILIAMHQSGELAKLLEEKKVLIPAGSGEAEAEAEAASKKE